jgi:glycerol-3-phosphate dehydrogenase
MQTVSTDVLIVGAGVVGCSVAARLSLDRVEVMVIERHHDVAEETSKSNTGVADSGWECTPGCLEAELVTQSSPQWEEVAERFDVPFRRCGGLCIARSEEEMRELDTVVAAAVANGVRTERLSREQLLHVAPYVTPDALGAVHVPDEGIIDSVRLTLGYAELAARNGVRFFFNHPLVSATNQRGRVTAVHTPSLVIRPRFIVNAAGLGADMVSRLLGGEDFVVWPRRGEYLLADREVGRRITKIVTRPPSEHTRGIMVVPSTHGSVLLGPTADDDEDKTDRSTHQDVLDRVLAESRQLVPDIPAQAFIKSFAGLRPASERTYRVEQSGQMSNLIQACAIRSTGVSSSPAMGEYVRGLLVHAGLNAEPRGRAVHALSRLPRLADGFDCAELASNPLGRTVVCACEKVTALEIHNAMQGKVPAASISAIAKRTRATWGRCQGSACLSGVSFIASQYLPGDAWSIPHGDPAGTLGVAKADRV